MKATIQMIDYFNGNNKIYLGNINALFNKYVDLREMYSNHFSVYDDEFGVGKHTFTVVSNWTGEVLFRYIYREIRDAH